ncbi:MAG: UxaA family hydrolase [Chloroflexi bacterium]|nr:UxaA family hydrolase [Chloroflexota bacterium]
MAQRAILMDAADNVATALADLPAGSVVEVFTRANHAGYIAHVTEDIPFGHKFALRSIEAGKPVIKYGCTIGTATADISTGQHVHVHNTRSIRGIAARPAPESEPV